MAQLPPEMMDDETSEPQQGPEQAAPSIVERIANLLREDLSIPHNHPIQVRQAPLQDGEDHDSWAGSDEPDAYHYLASQLVEMVQSENENTNDSEAPSADEGN